MKFETAYCVKILFYYDMMKYSDVFILLKKNYFLLLFTPYSIISKLSKLIRGNIINGAQKGVRLGILKRWFILKSFFKNADCRT